MKAIPRRIPVALKYGSHSKDTRRGLMGKYLLGAVPEPRIVQQSGPRLADRYGFIQEKNSSSMAQDLRTAYKR